MPPKERGLAVGAFDWKCSELEEGVQCWWLAASVDELLLRALTSRGEAWGTRYQGNSRLIEMELGCRLLTAGDGATKHRQDACL